MNTYVAAGCILVLGGAGWLYGHARYDAGRNDLLVEQSKAAAVAQKAHDERVVAGDAGAAKAVQGGEAKQSAAAVQTITVTKTVKEYIHDHPAPAVCVMPDADPVLRELAAAAERANAAADSVQRAGASGAR